MHAGDVRGRRTDLRRGDLSGRRALPRAVERGRDDALDALDGGARARGREIGEGARELAHVGEAAGGVLLQAAEDDGLHRGRRVGAQRSERWRRLLEDVDVELGDGLGAEGDVPGEQLEEDDAERPDVGALVDVARRPELLGSHVARRAHDGRGLRHGLALIGREGDLRDAEVEDLDGRRAVGPVREEQVRGLEIAVDDAVRVGLGEGLAGLQHVLDGLLSAERAALLDEVREVAAFEVLHLHERRAVLEHADVGDLGDVLARDLARGLGLAAEALDELSVLEHLGEQEFQRDLLVELEVGRRDDDAHAALSEDPIDTVFPREHRAGSHCAQGPRSPKRTVRMAGDCSMTRGPSTTGARHARRRVTWPVLVYPPRP